ncbi:MAG: EF-hand domain-containing protein [Vicinamibacterales bacterium]
MWRNGFKTVALAALPLTVALGAVDVSAQWRVVQPRAQQQDMRYSEMDVNGDGVVTRREWTGTRREFNAADWNRDGILSGEEVRIDADQPVGTSGALDRRSEFFNFDRNDDGVVNRTEWRGLRSTFDQLDANNDGVITQREFAANEVGRTARRPAARQASQVVFVDAQARWTPTGIYVNQGDQITFDARGIVQLSADPGDTAIAAGAYSRRQASNAPLPDELAGALIGRIGPGEAFGIGNQRQVTAPASGELFLGVNDDHLPDNRGGFRVQVK